MQTQKLTHQNVFKDKKMTLLKSIKEFMRVTATIDPEVICPHRNLGDSSVIQQKANRIGSRLNRCLPESFDFNEFVKELYSQENILDIDSDIHNRLTDSSVRNMPHYITGTDFPRLQLVEDLKYEGHSENEAINRAFSENTCVLGLHVEDFDELARPGESWAVYTFANDDILNLIIKTDFIKGICNIRGIKNINKFRKCKIGKWVDYQLGVIYPSYKVVCEMESICKVFEKEFQLARFMCLKGLAEAMYIYLNDLETGGKYKNSDDVPQYLQSNQNKIIQRNSLNYAFRKMTLRVTHSLFAADIENIQLTATKMVSAIMAILHLNYGSREIKNDISNYVESYYQDNTQSLINSPYYKSHHFKIRRGIKKNEEYGADFDFLYGIFNPE
jgi:hypothetical protein